MKPGDSVLLVHGLGVPDRVRVLELLPGSRLRVEFPSGSTLIVQASHVTSGAVTAPGSGHRRTDPDTAIAAARASVKGLHAAQWQVLDAIVRAGTNGLMDCEHEALTGVRPDSAGVRRKELERLGFVEDSGRRRQTPRGRQAAVHVATALGRLAWEQERGSHRSEGAA